MTGSLHWVSSPDRPLVDVSSVDATTEHFLDRLKPALDAANIRLQGWIVLNHDKPDWQPIMAAGSQGLPHTACPVANRSRLQGMLRRLDGTGWFESLQLELPDWTDAVHGAHHEIIGVALTPLFRLLLSICLCDGCREVFGLEVDWPALAKTVEADVAYFAEVEPPPSDPMLQLATYLLENPEITQLLRARSRWLGQFLANLKTMVRAELVPMVTSHQGHAELSWMSGFVPDPELFAHVILLGYGDPTVIAQDLNWMRHRGWDMDRILMGQTLVASATPRLEDAIERLQVPLAMGVTQYLFYNWGLCNDTRRGWLDPLCHLIRCKMAPSASGDLR